MSADRIIGRSLANIGFGDVYSTASGYQYTRPELFPLEGYAVSAAVAVAGKWKWK
jgi:hypothetical protein